MKKIWLLVLGLLGLYYTQITLAFDDINNHRYQTPIEQLKQQGILQGYPDNTFRPDQSITRAELTKVILSAANLEPLHEEESCFKDINPWQRFFDIICTAKGLGIIQGYPNNTFQPEKTITLVEALKIAILGFKMNVPENWSPLWYAKYLDFAHQYHIFSKFERFPEQNMTRGMMAHLAANLIQLQTWTTPKTSQSKGCQSPQPSLTPDTVTVRGQQRHFITKLGTKYQQTQPAKLIFGFHGRTSDHQSVASYYDLDQEEGNAIFIYPLGLPEEGPQRNRRDPGDKTKALRDYELFDAIKELISEQYCIDSDQIYVAGHSLGGRFTSMLNCARGKEIRGVGIVGGSPMPFPICNGPSAAIIFHNPADKLASFAGGEQIRNAIIKQNQCWPKTEHYHNNANMECIQYTECLPGAPVVFCKYFGEMSQGHMRPSQASSMMQKFRTEL